MLPDSMTRAASYILDADVISSSDDTYTIITSGDNAVDYLYFVGFADVNSICVWTVTRSVDADFVEGNVRTHCNEDMESFAVD